jgi:hypothetical protein
MGGRRPEGHITGPGNTRLQQTNRRQRNMEATLRRGSGPKKGCGAKDENELKTRMIVQLTLKFRIETSTFTENNFV